MTNIFTKTKNTIKDLLFPKKCVGCKKEGVWVCEDCKKNIVLLKTFFCPICKTITPNGQTCKPCRERSNLTGILMSAYFKGPIREAIHAFKYNGVKDLANLLTNLMKKRLDPGLPNKKAIIVPMPLHRKKKAERGFNQAEILGKMLAGKLNLKYNNKILKRIKDTKPQIGLESRLRKINIKDAFALNKKEDLDSLKNRTILLLDDVTTTGATLEEAAKVLRQAGARQVWGLVIAQG